MSNYPDGAENDVNAPWNLPDAHDAEVECCFCLAELDPDGDLYMDACQRAFCGAGCAIEFALWDSAGTQDRADLSAFHDALVTVTELSAANRKMLQGATDCAALTLRDEENRLCLQADYEQFFALAGKMLEALGVVDDVPVWHVDRNRRLA